MTIQLRTSFQRRFAYALMAALPLQGLVLPAANAAVSLADQPVFASNHVPGNLALALSVEYPTATRVAHVDNYSPNATFLGYFDPGKCYTYQKNTGTYITPAGVAVAAEYGDLSYFQPAGLTNSKTCTGAQWSGNFLNWAATAAIDPFRWAMTGGHRVVDTETQTILQKGWHSSQGSSYFPTRVLTDAAVIAGATPHKSTGNLSIQVGGRGFAMRITPSGGMKGEYFNNKSLTNPVIYTNPADSVNHDWGNGGPGNNVSNDNFSARYTGEFTAPAAGNYTFRTTSDDGVRLYVNGALVIDQWKDQGSTSYTHTAYLTGSFTVRLEYYENSGGAVMKLEWKRPNRNDYEVFTESMGGTASDYTMRVKVCDPSAAAGGVESNCKQYGSNYKPEGLLQKYANDMRFSAFGYLNDHNVQRDGGVLRAQQKFVGPTQPVPGQAPATNPAAEWSATTGVFVRNPDASDATNTQTAAGTGVTIADSGVINYLNKFGQLLPGTYKSADPVNELYYATLRYFRNLGNVPAWSALDNANNTATKTTWLDGFPVITEWNDPIQYSCQRNFVLGIGDIYTHRDKNVPGANTGTTEEPTKPALVSSDSSVDAVTATNRVGVLHGEGLGSSYASTATGSTNSRSYMAGLAFDANTKDIRPDVASVAKTLGKQTVQTYWVDVLEKAFEANNKFYLTAKFGGMKVPSNFDPYTFNGTIETDWWHTTGEKVDPTKSNSPLRPDNYFTAGRPDTMVSGLTRAFESIVGNIKAYTTSFSLSAKQISGTEEASYATQYDSADWTGELSGSSITIGDDGQPLLSATPTWTTTTRFEAQLGGTDGTHGTGWDLNRRVVSWNPDSANGAGAGVPFRLASLSSTQQGLLNTSYVTGDDSANYLKWLRGDSTLDGQGYRPRYSNVTNEQGLSQVKRKRLGDIVNSKVTVVTAPPASYSDTSNPGYAAFKRTHKDRQTMLYVGANDGMLHAFKGGLGTDAGQELFAYVPSALFHRDPMESTASTDGLLAQLGNPSYAHRNFVDATALVFDIDFNNAGGAFSTVNAEGEITADWRSVLIGGLGKGGRSYYAIDVTDPSAMTTETAVAGKVLWEFPSRSMLHTDAGGTCTTNCTEMGYTFGEPIVTKTAKYGWVAIFASGYNNVNGTRNTQTNTPQDGSGRLFIVDPRNGTLLETLSTGNVASSGLAHPTAYVRDYTDMTADAVYVGDLNGQLWRFDLTQARGATGSYPAPTLLARLTDSAGTAQPITTRPLVEIHPVQRKRFVLVGTGRLLHSTDIQSGQSQTFYGIIDGGIASFSATRANDNEAFPVVRSRLVNVAAATTGAIPQADVTSSAGWRLELGKTGPVGWRAIGASTAYSGIVGFTSTLPTGDACSPAGISRVYALNFGNAKTVLDNNVSMLEVSAVVTDLHFFNIHGKTRLIAGDNRGSIQTVPGNFSDPDPRRLSWREIPVGN